MQTRHPTFRGPRSRALHRRLLRGLLLSGLVCLLPTVAAPVDAAEPARSRSLDEVPVAEPEGPGGDNQAEARDLGEAPAARARPLDSLDRAEPGDPDNEGLRWSPAPCGAARAPELELPADPGDDDWLELLATARRRVGSAQDRLDEATERYAASLAWASEEPTRRARLGDARDAARREFSEARCDLLALRREASRRGVSPLVLGRFELPADTP